MHKSNKLCYNKNMDNSSFEQQFAQSLNTAPLQPANGGTSNSKLPIIISIVLAVIVVIESIALVITMNQYLSTPVEETAVTEEDTDENEDEPVDENYVYDNNDYLIAMNANCKAPDGSTIVLDIANNYTATGTLTGSGTYTVVNESLISLSNNSNVLYYDGWNLADGLVIYTCEQTNNTEE